MRRREFITLLGGAAAAWPLAARAQPVAKFPTIGFLGGSSSSSLPEWAADFVPRMREFGWVEGRTVSFEDRWADGRTERYAEIAAEFVRLKVDVIVTAGPPTFAANGRRRQYRSYSRQTRILLAAVSSQVWRVRVET